MSKHILPPNNPALIQNSRYPSVHFNSAQTDVTELPAWIGKWKVKPAQTKWLPWVTFIGTAHLPYPDGEEAIFIAGTREIFKENCCGKSETGGRLEEKIQEARV